MDKKEEKKQAWLALIVLVAAALILVSACNIITPFLNYIIWGIEH